MLRCANERRRQTWQYRMVIYWGITSHNETWRPVFVQVAERLGDLVSLDFATTDKAGSLLRGTKVIYRIASEEIRLLHLRMFLPLGPELIGRLLVSIQGRNICSHGNKTDQYYSLLEEDIPKFWESAAVAVLEPIPYVKVTAVVSVVSSMYCTVQGLLDLISSSYANHHRRRLQVLEGRSPLD